MTGEKENFSIPLFTIADKSLPHHKHGRKKICEEETGGMICSRYIKSYNKLSKSKQNSFLLDNII